eukprot:937557-Amphidinium_carterae.1
MPMKEGRSWLFACTLLPMQRAASLQCCSVTHLLMRGHSRARQPATTASVPTSSYCLSGQRV